MDNVENSPGLSQVSSSALGRICEGLRKGSLSAPIDRAGLLDFGIRNQLDALLTTLSGHGTKACIAILEAALTERLHRKPSPELVWTGPEGRTATARDTAVVLRALFEQARESVILAGYSFSHAHEVLEPLYDTMKKHGVQAMFFVNIPQIERAVPNPEDHAAFHLQDFLRQNWPFADPKPRLYYDTRALVPGPPYCSLHAKCVTVDGLRAFVSSANFTQRGQDRNIEAGVLIEDAAFAGSLANQWMGLVQSGWAREVGVSS